ncbi:hypothetical protein ACP70R_033570 [Stipagrostis hirtigluma subsp. patula]
MASKSKVVMAAPEINKVAAPGDGSVGSELKPANDGLKKAAVGGAARGTSSSLVEWILESLTSCYHSCCGVEQDDD